MSAESTTTTVNDIVYSYVIEPTFLDYAADHIVAQQFFRRYSLAGKPSAVLQIPRLASDMGTISDAGSGVDTEFGATEATDLSSNIALDTDNVQLTVAEYGFKRTITDHVFEDSILGSEFMTIVIADAARILTTAVESDCVSLFPGLSNSVGSSGSDLTVAQAVAAADGIRERGNRAPDGVVYVLDDQAYNDLRDGCIATGTSWAVFPQVAATMLGIEKGAKNGLDGGPVMWFRGFPVYASGLCNTANTAADVVSACFTHSTPANDTFATFSLVDKRAFRVETQRDASLRASEVVFSQRIAVGETSDSSGTKLVTDA
jgi:hypothetical protein